MIAQEISYYPPTNELTRDVEYLARQQEDYVRDLGAIALSPFTAGIVEPTAIKYDKDPTYDSTQLEQNVSDKLPRALGSPAVRAMMQRQFIHTSTLTEQSILGHATTA